MMKENVSISNPDELNKHLQSSSHFTWAILGVVVAMLLAFFVWSFIYRIPVKVTGTATVASGEVALNISEENLDKLEVGQTVHIQNIETDIFTFDDNGQPVVYNVGLADGEYDYYIVIREIRPIDFLIK